MAVVQHARTDVREGRRPVAVTRTARGATPPKPYTCYPARAFRSTTMLQATTALTPESAASTMDYARHKVRLPLCRAWDGRTNHPTNNASSDCLRGLLTPSEFTTPSQVSRGRMSRRLAPGYLAAAPLAGSQRGEIPPPCPSPRVAHNPQSSTARAPSQAIHCRGAKPLPACRADDRSEQGLAGSVAGTARLTSGERGKFTILTAQATPDTELWSRSITCSTQPTRHKRHERRSGQGHAHRRVRGPTYRRVGVVIEATLTTREMSGCT